MTEKEKNDLYYVCSLIEFVGRLTKNKNSDLVQAIGTVELGRQLAVAELNHCLTFEQVAAEMIQDFNIKDGTFDSVGASEDKVPHFISIGGVYSDLIIDLANENKRPIPTIMFEVFTSFINEAISDFNSSTFYENPSFIFHSYKSGYLLD